MKGSWAEAQFITKYFEDRERGCSGLELYRHFVHEDFASMFDDKEQHMATVTYWDAMGEFYLETFTAATPVPIIEELLAEARAKIKIR